MEIELRALAGIIVGLVGIVYATFLWADDTWHRRHPQQSAGFRCCCGWSSLPGFHSRDRCSFPDPDGEEVPAP